MTHFTPVLPTQSVYRTLLQAMAHPCRPYPFKQEQDWTLLQAVAETLLDHEVSLCLHESCPAEWAEDLYTRTKAEQVNIEEADYLIVNGSCPQEDLYKLKTGDPLFPDKSATVIQVLSGTSSGPGPWIEGPGLKEKAHPVCNPLKGEEWEAYRSINADYPLGIDLIALIDNQTVCALPRSTRIM